MDQLDVWRDSEDLEAVDAVDDGLQVHVRRSCGALLGLVLVAARVHLADQLLLLLLAVLDLLVGALEALGDHRLLQLQLLALRVQRVLRVGAVRAALLHLDAGVRVLGLHRLRLFRLLLQLRALHRLLHVLQQVRDV